MLIDHDREATIQKGDIKLIQPQHEKGDNIPNTCFIIVRPKPDANGKLDFPLPGEDGFTENSVLFQSGDDYCPLATSFGWGGEEGDSDNAYDFLMENIGKVVSDPGYFGD